MSKVERTTFVCVFHLIIHLEQNQKGGGVHLIHSSLFSRNILWTYIDVVHVTCVVIRQALFSLCIFPRGQQLPTQTHGTLCQRGFLFNTNATTTKDLCPSRFCASFIYGAKKSTFYFFFTKKESALSLIDSILEPQASYTPLPIPYITNTSYMGRTRCLHKQLISNEGLSTYKHVIRVLNIVYKWWISADIKILQ